MSAVGAADSSPGRKPGDQATKMFEPRRGDRYRTARRSERVSFNSLETRLLPQAVPYRGGAMNGGLASIFN